MTEFTMLKTGSMTSALEIWSSPSVSQEAVPDKAKLPKLVWRPSSPPDELSRALSSGEAQVVILTLDDILGSGYEGIPAQARATGAWLLVLVPEPHPFFEMVADRRLLVRSEAVPQVLQGLMRNMLGTD